MFDWCSQYGTITVIIICFVFTTVLRYCCTSVSFYSKIFIVVLPTFSSMFAVGISLGFSSTYVAVSPLAAAISPSTVVLQESSPPSINVVANSAGHRKTHPCCAFTDSGEVLFGDTAHEYYVSNPDKVIPSIFAYAALENVNGNASAENREIKEKFQSMIDCSVSVKYKGHKTFTDDGSTLRPIDVDSENNGIDLPQTSVTATSLFIQYLNHLKEHSVDAPCSLKRGDQTTKSIFLTLSVPRYAFPTLPTQGKEACEWVVKAVMESEFRNVVQKVHFLFSDESALLGADFLFAKRGNSSTEDPTFFLPSKSVLKACNIESNLEIRDRNVLVVDWGAQGVNFTKLRLRDGMLTGETSQTPFFSTVSSPSSPSLGGDSMDVTLADRVALAFIQQKRQLFSSQIPHLSSVLLSQRDTLGKMNSFIKEHIPSRAMRRLRLRMEERKSSLLRNSQITSVPVEVEAFYEGIDLLDTKTLMRHKVESAMENEWGLVDKFSHSLKEFLAGEKSSGLSTEFLNSSSLAIHHVVLCGGVCQNASFATALQKILLSVLPDHVTGKHSLPSTSSISVTSVSKLDGNVRSEEIFAVGGCLHSYLSGTMKLNSDLASKKGIQKGSSAQGEHRPSRKEIQRAMLRSCWNVLETGMGCDDGKNPSRCLMVNFLLQNIYLYTNPDISELRTQGDNMNGFQLPSHCLTKLFSQGTALPSRVLLKWPEGTTSVVLFFFNGPLKETDSIDIPNRETSTGSSGLICCWAISSTGIPLNKPSLPPNRSACIAIGAVSESGQPVLQIQIISRKNTERVDNGAPLSMNGSNEIETAAMDSTRTHFSVNVNFPCSVESNN